MPLGSVGVFIWLMVNRESTKERKCRAEGFSGLMHFEVLEQHPHGDIVTDIAFDYYGKRFATCSADKHIKVWNWEEESQRWQCDDLQQRAHNDIVYRLSWAHPEFGQLLASCSEDGSIKVWEEQGTGGDVNNAGRWMKRAQLNQSCPVRDIKFSFRGLGLIFAAACGDGYVRLYEARDVFDLTSWDMKVQFQAEEHIPGVGEGATSVAWNDGPDDFEQLAVGGSSRRVTIYTVNGATLKKECILNGGHLEAISDIAWAPAMGRSYHTIAVASRENTIKIYTLKRSDTSSVSHDPKSVAIITCEAPVWRVAWNATGTLLAASSEEGKISLWRKDFAGQWFNIQNIPVEKR